MVYVVCLEGTGLEPHQPCVCGWVLHVPVAVDAIGTKLHQRLCVIKTSFYCCCLCLLMFLGVAAVVMCAVQVHCWPRP